MKTLKFIGALLVGFFTLSFGVNALTISENYTLQEDSNEYIEVAENANVIIDLNEKTLEVTGKSDAIIINDGATVVIKGNGKVLSEQAAIFNKGGSVTVENGSFDSSVWYTIKNLGTMTINGGTFTQSNKNAGNSSLIANGWAGKTDKGVAAPESGTEAVANMTINGGTFIHHTTTSTIKSDDWSKTVISGGNYESKNGTLLQATGEVIVNNGDFVGYNNIALFNGTGEKGYEPALLTIKGGTFSAKYIIWTFTSGTLTISGGEFNDILDVRNPDKELNEYKETITGGTYAIDIKSHVATGYKSFLSNEKYIVAKTYEVLNHAGDNGKLSFDKDLAAIGEAVTMTITPDEGYEIESIRIIDKDNNVIEVKDNKFTMPASDVWVSVKFSPIQTTEAPVVDENNIIGVNDTDKTKDVLLDTIAKDDKYKDMSVSVEIVVEDIEATDTVEKEFNKALEENKNEDAKIVSYFDITIAVKNNVTDKLEGTLSELTEEIEFKVELPILDAVKEGFVRNYYVIKKHDDKVEIIDAKVSKDGKYITFATDEFSTYALAYEDVKEEVKEDIKDTNTVTPEVPKTENNEKVPQTFDGITTTLILGTLSIISIAGLYFYFKRELENK